MATVAASPVAAVVASTRLLLTRPQNSISFPRRPPPATTALSVSTPTPAPAPALTPPAANPKYHNAKADAGDDGDVDGEELLRRFTQAAARAGVLEEVRRRRRREDARDRRKRKARAAARRFRRRRFKGPYPSDDEQGSTERTTDDDENDNWELPGGKLPSYK